MLVPCPALLDGLLPGVVAGDSELLVKPVDEVWPDDVEPVGDVSADDVVPVDDVVTVVPASGLVEITEWLPGGAELEESDELVDSVGDGTVVFPSVEDVDDVIVGVVVLGDWVDNGNDDVVVAVVLLVPGTEAVDTAEASEVDDWAGDVVVWAGVVEFPLVPVPDVFGDDDVEGEDEEGEKMVVVRSVFASVDVVGGVVGVLGLRPSLVELTGRPSLVEFNGVAVVVIWDCPEVEVDVLV